MTRGIWTPPGGETRTCLVCEEQFTPTRRAQRYCPLPRRCRYTQKARHLSKAGSLDPRPCGRCEAVYTPRRKDQRTCGINCPGKPDQTRTCANPACASEFTVSGSPGKGRGHRKYCTRLCRDSMSRWRLAERFRRYGGMTPEQFQAKAEAQSGLCMICKKEPVPDGRSRRDGIWALEQDHDHLTGILRDLLCGHCNKGIGMFNDDPDLLRAAADYIERHRSASALT
jgi:Recombination endonuclease VII